MPENSECREWGEIVIELRFCKHEKMERCRRRRDYSIKRVRVNLLDFYSIDEVVDYVLDKLAYDYEKAVRNRDLVMRWREKIRPYIYEYVYELVRNYIWMLMQYVNMCDVGIEPSVECEPIEYGYPRLYAILDYRCDLPTCECVEELTELVARYEDLVLTAEKFVEWKATKLKECDRKRVEFMMKNKAPLETLLEKYGLKDFVYEVYYHE